MSLLFRVGASAETSSPGLIRSVSSLYSEGLIDHLQIVVIPEKDPGIFRTTCDLLGSLEVPVLIHAPYHRHGVNLCAPDLYSPNNIRDLGLHTEHAMMQTRDLADLTGSPWIVIHAGMYHNGMREEANDGFQKSLDDYYDPRMILENLPARYGGLSMLGTTCDELHFIGKGRIKGFCLDFAHLYCTSNYLGSDYITEIGKFSGCEVRLMHFSSTQERSRRDEHLPLTHPLAGLPMHPVMEYIRHNSGIPVCLEYKENAAFYRTQIEAFRDCWNAAGKSA